MRPRAGAYALSLLSVPLNVHVLQALEEETRPLIELRRAVGSPPQTTMRKHLRALTEIGVLQRRRQNDFPGSVEYALGRPGEELLAVGASVQTWLAASPENPAALGSVAAKSAIKALVEAWSTTIVRALAARPLALTELNRLISGISYPSLERRLGAMRLAGQIEARPGNGRGMPYSATKWLRRSVAPLTAAARWERRHVPGAAAPISRLDTEAAFLLSVPLLRLPEDLSGDCRLAVELNGGGEGLRAAGVTVGVREGRVVSCVSRLQGDAPAWVCGSAAAWLGALMEHDTDRLEIGGDREVATALLEDLHGVLFGARQMR